MRIETLGLGSLCGPRNTVFYPRPLSNETKSISIQISGQNVGNDDLNFNSHCQFDSNIHNFEKYA